jgi:hypothetical protein
VSGCASQTDLPSSEDSHKLLRSPQRERGARASSAAVKHSLRRRLPCINGPPYTSDCTVLKLGEQLPSGPLVAALLLVALRSTISPPSASNEGPGTGEHHWPIRERRMSRWCTHSKPGLTGGSLRGRWLPHAVAFTPTARYPLCEGDRVRSWSSLLHATTDQPLSVPFTQRILGASYAILIVTNLMKTMLRLGSRGSSRRRKHETLLGLGDGASERGRH